MNETVFKVLFLCLLTSSIAVMLRQKNSEYAFLLSVAAGTLIGVFLLKSLFTPIKQIGESLENYGIRSDYFKVALKAVGIGYITQFVSDSCKDCGQVSLALKAELAGKCAIFLLSVPLMISVLETAVGFLK